MRLTLDWDTEEDRQENFPNLPQSSLRTPWWSLYRSSTGGGYHYLEHGLTASVPQTFELREVHGDDPKRLRLDRKRWSRGSPFISVLYDRKYMDRGDSPPWNSGNQTVLIDGSLGVPEEEKIKFGNRLDYQKIARLLTPRYGGRRGLAQKLGVSRSTVGRWVRRENEPNDAHKKRLRRLARSQGIGHYQKTPGGGQSADSAGIETFEINPMDYARRRLLVEYIDVPWADTPEQIARNIDENEETDYSLTIVHTGSMNRNHKDGQLKMVHDKVVKHVLEVLSPTVTGPKGGGAHLDVQRRNEAFQLEITREPDSINLEDKLIDRDEKQRYVGNLPPSPLESGPTVEEPGEQIIFEVIVWRDADMRSMEWHVLGFWRESVEDAVILSDSRGWW